MESWNWYQFCGYIIITLGFLIYSETIVIPFFGLNLNTKMHILKATKQHTISTEFDKPIQDTQNPEDIPALH